MPTDVRNSKNSPQPILVGVAAWLLPGAGYWLLGHRARGLTVCVTILVLFVLGLLIGGVRVIEVPTYNRAGESTDVGLVTDVRSKPWSVAQVMVGPVGIAAGALSVYAARPDPSAPAPDPDRAGDARYNPHPSRGVETHSRTNEIAVLYTAVAGMLNLLVIIDAVYRAGKLQEGT